MSPGFQSAVWEFGRCYVEQQAGRNARLPMDIHTRYDSGQYLFLITFSPGHAFAKAKGAHQKEQREGYGIVSTFLPELKA